MKLLIITQKVDSNDQLLGFFIEWLRIFAQKFEKLTVLCLEKGEYNLPQNVEIISLGKDRGDSKLKQLLNFYLFIFSHRKTEDAVFVHMNPIWMVLGGLCWKLMGKKRFLWYTHKAVTFKLRLAEKFADKIFTASPESFRVKSKKVIVTGHGIDTELFKPDPNYKLQTTNYKLLSVGRISPVKNYDTLIDAVKILKNEGLDLKVTMVGEPALNSDTRYLANLKSKVKSLTLEDDFDFVGKIKHTDLPSYYQSNDLFIHLSKTGSLDKTILEAMASGMKVLSSNDASRGFLPPELIFNQDDPAELAAKIKNIRTVQVRNLRQYVIENHSLDKLIDKIYKVCVSKNITIYPFPYSSKSNKYISLLYSKVDNVRESKSFSSLLAREPGVIHIHWTNVVYGSKFFIKTIFLMIWNLTLLSLLKIKGFRIVWTQHNYYPHDSRWIWLDKIGQKALFNVADAVTIHEKSEEKNKKVFYISHGNYIGVYGPISNKRDEMRSKFGFTVDDIVLISLGAIKPYKKIENIITSFNGSKASQMKLLIAGKCDPYYAVKLKSSIGNSDNIKLDCDFVPDKDVPDYLAMADYSVFWYDNSVLTSGGIILSLSYGIPVIARNISAADLIKDGKNGFLFNNEQELSDIIKNLPNAPKFDPDRIISTVREFGWDKISDEFAKLYYSLWN